MSSKSNGMVEENHQEEVLRQVHTAGSIQLSPEFFQHLYLSPQNNVEGNLRQTFGNPTPIGLLLCSTPASPSLLGWQGAVGFLAGANVGAYLYVGGLLLGFGGYAMSGNTFPAIVFFTFAGFLRVYGIYSTGEAAEGLNGPQFYAAFALLLIGMTIPSAISTVACVRTNLVFLLVFVLFTLCFACLAGSFFAVSNGDSAEALNLQHAGAGILLAASTLGWYNFLALVLLSVDFPLTSPLGDLSTIVPGSESRTKKTADAV
ncbi:hypothetical protein EDB80DRAFT_757962 [Ilyonectria destructans]|nr:hypothetical protein EDB80DRAFT_757962 [Ilyonectria destructans]